MSVVLRAFLRDGSGAQVAEYPNLSIHAAGLVATDQLARGRDVTIRND
jgi:hypothetical protein